ncbi:Septal ring factor EnvC, activator of murein hydrolases AmiA and AmiB [Marinobacter daqiaonensis]|uniref:Septal ring factor EnvC, activator of murein hydrolases AmiA and AmiB n=1 Tax=Marinobacter daqiaonensis TaxID=650891 RepID=A0A1I6HSD6_9GAMM|nr:peptidoglycan DD-metalloendopeptidase family protein [Marinobacter daqiaonensis]SFR57298.1 Septal ring factor EnvC, activator of murein hydrolases AmiA and AmiB [Marinobacter daqiaonensis]
MSPTSPVATLTRSATGILRLALFCVLLLATGMAGAEQQVTPAQVEALKKEIEKIDRWLSDAEKDRSQLERTLAQTEKDISRLTRERRELQDQRRQQEQELATLQKSEKILEQTLSQQKTALKKQLRGAWMEGKAPAIKVLLNEASPEEIARTMTYYEYLSGDNLQRLETFNATLAELKQTRQQKLEARSNLVRLEEQVASRQKELKGQQANRERTLAALKQDIDERRTERGVLEADRERLEKLLREVEEAIASIPSPTETEPFQKRRGSMPWPAKGNLAAAFGGAMAQGHLRRNGILLNTAEEADVQVVHYGRVVFANWLRGFGMMTIVDHGDGYMTLYGHSSSLLTSPGDWVQAGETIALAGRSGGTEDPAVYFELRHNGKPKNPMGWFGKR